MPMSSLSRYNPKTGIVDFWHEFRKPNPLRWPMLAASTIPLLVIGYWLTGETHYRDPERPTITYITTFDPGRSDEDIIASNEANQEVKELRQAAEDELANRKREIYKALGAGIGMDVDKIAAEADARRAAEEAAEQARRDELYTRREEAPTQSAEGVAADAPPPSAQGNRP
ncbi:MAG: hypothetical protein AAGB23_11515 [Pseudomonadota bacterium]